MDNNAQINTFYVSEKISKVRWIPEHLQQPKKFVTGSWDNSGKNSIKLWKFVKNEYFKDENESVPKCADKMDIKGDITEIIVMNAEKFYVSSGDGCVRLMQVDITSNENSKIIQREKSELIHKNQFDKPCCCTGMSILDKSIATIGEDGKINILDINMLKRIYQLDHSDNCTLTAVSFITLNELLVGNRMGIIKVLDARTRNSDANVINLVVSFENENKSNFATSLCWHPTQKHIVFAGTEEGSITIWDLRQPNFPASYLSAHSSSITEISFDRSQHTKLFTASEDGELWQWNQNNSLDLNLQLGQANTNDVSEINPWLNGERTKSKVNVTSIISGIGKAINSFDSYNSKIICGCDSEAVYYIDNIY